MSVQRTQVSSLPRVRTFLDSVGVNSSHTRYVYLTALVHLHHFLQQQPQLRQLTPDSIITDILSNNVNVYEFLQGFMSYLAPLSTAIRTKRLFIAAVKSYFGFHDIDISPTKFKHRVKVPQLDREDELALEAADIRKILHNCNNRRLKPYLLTLASGGFRAIEAIAIRHEDLDFSVSPSKVHIRKEYSKTRTARDVYISDEATQHIKNWINWKFRKTRPNVIEFDPESLVFAADNSNNPINIYHKINQEWHKVLSVAGFNERKDGMKRRKITFHSFRRFVKTVIRDQVNQDYSEWFLGYNKSPYYTKKEQARSEIYATTCMKYLTFLDYGILEATGKSIESKLSEKDSEIQAMKMKYEQDMKVMREEINQQFNQIMSMIQQNPKLAQIKPEVLGVKKL